MTAPLTIGFDAMCADISLLNIGPHLDAVREAFPALRPLMDPLARGIDEELAAENLGIGPGELQAMLDRLGALEGVEVDVHIGANAALEIVTAQGLLADPAHPIRPTDVFLLGNTSAKVLDRVPEAIRPEILRHAEPIDAEALSIIFPHGGKRVILSYGGDPPLRRLADPLRGYLRDRLPAILDEIKPGISLLVGTTCTWATADADDFGLLEETIAAVKRTGALTLLDLGGIGGWSPESRRLYFDAIAGADLVFCNEDELARLYEDRTGRAPLRRGAPEVAAMAGAVARDGQAFVVHTPTFQVALGLPEAAVCAMDFASRTAAVRASEGVFPSARQVADAPLAIAPAGEAERERMPRVGDAIAAAAYGAEARNTVGLGDTWTASFILAALGLGIL